MKARPKSALPGGDLLGFIEGRTGTVLIFFVLLPLMACLVLILPPISLPSRLSSAGYVTVAKAAAEIKDPDGTVLLIPEGAVTKGGSIKLTSTPLANAQSNPLIRSLPGYLEVKSPLYTFSVQGERPKQSTLSVPVPNEAEPYETLDLYARYGELWFKIPFVLNEQEMRLDSDLNFVPDAVVVAQTLPQAPVIAAMINSKKSPPAEAAQVLVEVNPTGLRLADEGALAGDIIALPETSAYSSYAIIPTVTNTDETGPRLDLTETMLSDDGQRQAHIRTLVDLAVQKLYAGYNIAYEGLTSKDRDAYTAFIKELARELHAQQKVLSVTLPAPQPVSEDTWETEGYDWALLGRYSDEVKIPLLSDPKAFEGDVPLVNQYLKWAAGQVDRYKLQLVFSTMARDASGDQVTFIPASDTFKLLGPISVPQEVHPGDQVTLDLPNLRTAGGIQYHQASGLFYFNYKDQDGAAHTVWLENADSLAKMVDLLLKYNLHGVALRDTESSAGFDPRLWGVLSSYRSSQPTSLQSNLAIVWLVDGKVAGKSTADNPKFVWNAPADAGKHTVDVALSVDNGESFTPGGEQLAVNVQAKATPVPPTATPKPKPTEKPAATPAGPKPTTAPKPAGPPPAAVGVNRFGYGIQLNWTGADREAELSQVNALGFGWVKIQVRWCDISGGRGQADYSAIDDMVAKAAAHGVKVLFSVVCAPGWSRADGGAGGSGPPDNMQDAADFMGDMAGRYCGSAGAAIEVWNEHNLLTEWHGKPLSAALYMDMLKRSYTAIKAKCGSMIVVSGAPTPTGWNDGVVAIDDVVFLEQLYQNGLKQYSDAIGAHPSGFNVPALCDIRDPGCNRPGVSFASPFQNRHHSWSFLSTMRSYRDVMVKYGDNGKQIWATEFGWPVGTGGGAHPAGADNSPSDLATWFPQAFQWAKQQGWVGVMIVWNLDFHGGEVGAFHIDDQPAFGALQAMPK